MPMYMDRHDFVDVTAGDIAEAHVADVDMQDQYGVEYLTYWFDPDRGAAFCLVDAPDLQSAVRVHRESHGLVASQVIRVDEESVERYLGKIGVRPLGEPYVESAFRTILFTDVEGSTSLTGRLGDVAARAILREHDALVREGLGRHRGNEVKHTGDGIMASFSAVGAALEASITIQRGLDERNAAAEIPIAVRIGVSAGEPVTEHGDLFGSAVQLAARACSVAQGHEILVSSAVRELARGSTHRFTGLDAVELKGFDDPVQLFQLHWRE